MLKETQGWKAKSKCLGQERAAGMRTAENLWHTMKLSPEGAAIHPAAGGALGGQGALSVPCESGERQVKGHRRTQSSQLLFFSPPSFRGKQWLSLLQAGASSALRAAGACPAGGKVLLQRVILPELSSTHTAPTPELLCPWSMF